MELAARPVSTLQDRITSRGAAVIFSLQLLSAIAFSSVFSLLTLYLLNEFHQSITTAYNLVAAYNALGYATSILGGYLAERFLGYRFAIFISLLLGLLGLCLLAIPKIFALNLGLACFTLSYGILIPAVFVLLGSLHKNPNSIKRNSHFVLAYIGMDAGAFIAAIASGYISIYVSYSIAFLLGALFLLISLTIFAAYKKLFIVANAAQHYFQNRKWRSRCIGISIMILFLPVLLFLLNHASFCNLLMIALGLACVGYIIYYACKQNNAYSGKLIVFLVLIIVSTAYDASYFLTPSALTVFTSVNINRHILGVTIPTAVYSALNPLFIITVGPLLNRVWSYLNRINKMPSLPKKFAIGITFMGCGYLILMQGALHGDSNSLISPWWLAGGLFLQTTGELFISPAGYAMVGILVPVYLEGIMMGISQFSTGVASAISSYLSNWVSPPDETLTVAMSNHWYQHAFFCLAVGAFCIAFVLSCITPRLNKLANQTNEFIPLPEILPHSPEIVENL